MPRISEQQTRTGPREWRRLRWARTRAPFTRTAPVILFDGVCNLCNRSVNFIIDRDATGLFRFASLQSSAGRDLTSRFGLEADQQQTLILVEGDRCYTRSTAALRIASKLRGPWKALYLLIVVPKPIRDGIYNWVSRNRYTWFGRSETCRIPTPELRRRFLD